MSPKRLKAIYALLCDKFCVLPNELGKLTWKQRDEILLHKRDRKTGAIVFPSSLDHVKERVKEWTFEEELMKLEELGNTEGFKRAHNDIEKLKEQLRVKYAARSYEPIKPEETRLP